MRLTSRGDALDELEEVRIAEQLVAENGETLPRVRHSEGYEHEVLAHDQVVDFFADHFVEDVLVVVLQEDVGEGVNVLVVQQFLALAGAYQLVRENVVDVFFDEGIELVPEAFWSLLLFFAS